MARASTLVPGAGQSRWRLPTNVHDYLAYAAMHLACLGVLVTGVSWRGVALCVASYLPRMFGLIAGYHRYFAHRSYKMSRPVQFAMALLGSLAVQKGVLWWAETHRHHHRFSDEPEDIHSPLQRSFLYSHSGWFLDDAHRRSDPSKVPDLAAYPELRWLNDWNLVPVVLYAAGLTFAFGLEGLVWGFFVSTVLIWHGIHAIGSFAHRFGGYRRFPTTDNSRNKWFLALVTLGEGWHNNHHYYPASARQGFYWYEIDLAYYGLKVLSWVGLVRDIKEPPAHVLRGEFLPGYQRRLLAFQRDLMGFRRRLDEAIETAVEGAEPAPDEIARVRAELCRKRVADRIDRYDEAAYSLLVAGPVAMLESYGELADDVRELAASHLEEPLGRAALLQVVRAIEDAFVHFGRRPEFLGKAAA